MSKVWPGKHLNQQWAVKTASTVMLWQLHEIDEAVGESFVVAALNPTLNMWQVAGLPCAPLIPDIDIQRACTQHSNGIEAFVT